MAQIVNIKIKIYIFLSFYTYDQLDVQLHILISTFSYLPHRIQQPIPKQIRTFFDKLQVCLFVIVIIKNDLDWL